MLSFALLLSAVVHCWPTTIPQLYYRFSAGNHSALVFHAAAVPGRLYNAGQGINPPLFLTISSCPSQTSTMVQAKVRKGVTAPALPQSSIQHGYLCYRADGTIILN